MEDMTAVTPDENPPPEPVWSKQPLHREERPTIVTSRFYISQISDVDTATFQANIMMYVWLFWSDPRLDGWDTTEKQLPPDLWTPRINLSNGKSELLISVREIHLTSNKGGDMYSLTTYGGPVYNYIENLKAFPCDMDGLTLDLYASWYVTSSGMMNVQFKSDYRLVLDNTLWQTSVELSDIADWKITGTIIRVINPEHCQDAVQIEIRMKRKTNFYILKVIVPLGLTMMMGTCGFFFDLSDLEARLNHMTTMLLSTFALIYVVSQDLPKTDFLTKIDIVMLVTMISFVFSGLISVVIDKVNDHEHDLARLLNTLSIGANIFSFICVSLLQFVPSLLKRRREEKKAWDEAVAAGNDPNVKKWKLFDPSIPKKNIEILQKDGNHIFMSCVEKARSKKRVAMSSSVEKDMLVKGETFRIMRLDIDHNFHCWRWEKYNSTVTENGDKLPTCEELAESGVTSGLDVDFWVPVRREDGIQNDYCQIGNHGSPKHKGKRYFSHKDEFGPTQWQESPWPDTWRPLEYIFIKKEGDTSIALP